MLINIIMKKQTCLILSCLLFLACGGGGGGGGSSESNAPPPAPQNVLLAAGNTQVSLVWTEAVGATSYNIYWSTAAGVRKNTGSKISNVTSIYYHTGLTNGTTMYYVVTATNQYGESSESKEVSATPSPLNPPLPPSDVATLAGDRKVIIRWTSREAGEAASPHNIYWSNNAGVTKENGTKISGAANPYTHTNLTNELPYYYIITGVNNYGEGFPSAEVSATPDQGNVPSAPTGIKAVAGNREALISWNAVDKAVTYNIYWSLSAGISSQNGTKLSNVKSPYNHTGLTQGSTYYYVITAVNGYGESADSDKISAVIPDSRKDVCIALGDSITAGGYLTSYDSSYVPLLSAKWKKTVINEAVNGAHTSYGALTIDEVLFQHNPRYITIYFGSNDLGFVDPNDTIRDLQYMIERAKNNGTIPVVATMGPFLNNWAWRQPYATELSRKIRQLAASQGVACADIEAALGGNSHYMIPDGMHPNDEGHKIIADTFYNALTR
ncbi:MAG: GDSL-type esterase/lipase family protein [Thermodesulfobacteriota bacterium]